MIVEPFESRQLNNFGSQSPQSAFIGVNNRGSLQKIIGAQRREKARAATRRKNMIGAGKVIA